MALTPVSASASHNDRRLAETRRQLRAARAKLATLVRSESEIESVIRGISSQLGRTRTELAGARARLSQINTRIATEKARVEEIDAETASRSAAIENRARTLYILGPGFEVSSLLTADSYEQFIGRTAAFEHVLRYDKARIEEMASLKNESQKMRAALERKRVSAKELAADIAEREAIQAEILSTKRQAESQLSKKIADKTAEIRALQREQARIEAIIRSRQSIGTGPVSRSGFAWPIRGRITSPYGYRGREFHTGMDIDCRTGDGIGASKAGVVIAAEWGGGYGNMVIIDHGNGVSTLYAHNSRLYVSRGTQVSQGQRISACGSTGRSTGDHLHFEVRINGKHQNPRHFLP